ncbi:predicted protein [Plenodomus lingam JN3]|uniref:Predicted protein n=1 Tax=Leptosphaeria maculans (strain JN3 / isolate v23.1.3 / race Av1-4-5-6-7-8) TaxID=985895 RepID=E5AFH6_LEPMJ|nr:predicted protein [Plenodomus lingam JN3]CBY01965.1 predicted protein [Plenodomus lingam JN3]
MSNPGLTNGLFLISVQMGETIVRCVGMMRSIYEQHAGENILDGLVSIDIQAQSAYHANCLTIMPVVSINNRHVESHSGGTRTSGPFRQIDHLQRVEERCHFYFA